MAVGIHVATIVMKQINSAGQVVDKETATMGQMLRGGTEQRVNEDPDIPNTSGNPTVKDYLEAEAQDNYTLSHIDQTFVITYEQTP